MQPGFISIFRVRRSKFCGSVLKVNTPGPHPCAAAPPAAALRRTTPPGSEEEEEEDDEEDEEDEEEEAPCACIPKAQGPAPAPATARHAPRH